MTIFINRDKIEIIDHDITGLCIGTVPQRDVILKGCTVNGRPVPHRQYRGECTSIWTEGRRPETNVIPGGSPMTDTDKPTIVSGMKVTLRRDWDPKTEFTVIHVHGDQAWLEHGDCCSPVHPVADLVPVAPKWEVGKTYSGNDIDWPETVRYIFDDGYALLTYTHPSSTYDNSHRCLLRPADDRSRFTEVTDDD